MRSLSFFHASRGSPRVPHFIRDSLRTAMRLGTYYSCLSQPARMKSAARPLYKGRAFSSLALQDHESLFQTA